MCGLGIDVSVASAEEIANAINNQEPTQEEADNYVLTFGKHKGEKLKDIPTEYIEWMLGNSKDERMKKLITLATGIVEPTPEEQNERIDLIDTILQLCDEKNVDERESFYIKEYDSMNPEKGYNRDTGGNENKVFSAETRKLISESHDGQPILQFDLEGNLLAEWEYIQLAVEALELDSKNISACLHGKTGQCGGYQWKFKDDPQIVGKYQEYDGRRKINQYDLDGHFIDTWDSIIDIYLSLGINTAGIIKCCQFKRK